MAPQPNTEIDLDELTDAIVAVIAGAFPAFETVEAYRADYTSLPTPACLIELADLEPQPDIGTEQLPVLARFEARVIMGFRAHDVKRAVPKLAAALALRINQNRWARPVEPAAVTAIERDEFDPDLDQFEVWRVDWQQTIHIGPSIWGDEGSPPSRVLGSWVPDIGPANEDEYTDISEATA